MVECRPMTGCMFIVVCLSMVECRPITGCMFIVVYDMVEVYGRWYVYRRMTDWEKLTSASFRVKANNSSSLVQFSLRQKSAIYINTDTDLTEKQDVCSLSLNETKAMDCKLNIWMLANPLRVEHNRKT